MGSGTGRLCVVRDRLYLISNEINIPRDNIRIDGEGFFNFVGTWVKFGEEIWRFMHRASSYNMYMNQQDVQNSCD